MLDASGTARVSFCVICCTGVTIGLRSNQSRKEKYEQNLTCSYSGLLRIRVLVPIAHVEDANDGRTLVGSNYATFHSALCGIWASFDGGVGRFGIGLLHLCLDAKGG